MDAEQRPVDEVRLVVFNLLQLPVLSLVNGGPRRLRAARRVLESLDADVIVLNEAMNRGARRLAVDGLGLPFAAPEPGHWRRRRDWTTSTGDDSRWRRPVGSGVRVLSRFPLTEAHQYVYRARQRGTQDWWANKGIALVRVHPPGGPLWVAATHLQADEPPMARARTQEVRAAQLVELRELVHRHVPRDEPVVVAGDLNIDASSREAETAGEILGGTLLPHGSLHAPTFDGTRNPLAAKEDPTCRQVIDHVGHLHDPGRPVPRISVETVVTLPGEVEPSDHYPVLARIALPNRLDKQAI